MASASTYLNFERNTEKAFNFYKSVFGGEFFGNGIMRFGDVPADPNCTSVSDEDKNLVMHVELKILGCHSLMGTDVSESMGFKLTFGNNSYINLQPDTRKETKELFDKLSEDGEIGMELQDMFWGDYFGSCTDQFGVKWMFNCAEKQ